MPTYQYACTDCAERLEVVQSFTDEPLSVCSSCGGRLRKVFSPVGIVFKGSGFYRTDSRSGPDVKTKTLNGSEAASTQNGKSGSDGSDARSGSDSGSSSGDKKAAAANGSSSSGSSGGSGGSGRSGRFR